MHNVKWGPYPLPGNPGLDRGRSAAPLVDDRTGRADDVVIRTGLVKSAAQRT